MNNKNRPPRNSSVFFLLKTQFENVGDALINKSLLAELSSRGETFVDVTFCPEHFVQNLSVSGLGNTKLHLQKGILPLFLGMIRRRLAGDRIYFVLPPGGSAGEKRTLSYIFNLAYNRYLATLKTLGVQLVSAGVSYDDMGPRFAKIVRGRAALIKHHYVRDELSAKTLEALGATFSGFIPDLAFTLPFDFTRLAQARSGVPKIAFSFRTDKQYVDREKVVRLIEQVIDAVPGTSVVFVSQVQRDSEFMRSLYERFKKSGRSDVSLEETALSLTNATDVYRDCDYIFSNRLHALLLALSAGTTPIAMLSDGRDNKIRGVFNDAKLIRNVFNLDKDDFEATWLETTLVSDISRACIAAKKKRIDDVFDTILQSRQ